MSGIFLDTCDTNKTDKIPMITVFMGQGTVKIDIFKD